MLTEQVTGSKFAFVAVSVYVTSSVTDTTFEPSALTVPTPLLIDTVPAFDVSHASVTEPPPSGSEFGLAVKLSHDGAFGVGVVTFT